MGYLLDKAHAEAEEILVLAFARKAREELQQRVRSRYEAEPNIRTFHSLGMAILTEADGRRPTLARVAESDIELRRLLERFLDRLFEVRELHELAFRFFPYYLKPYQNEFEFESKDEHYRSLRARDIRTLKDEIVQSHAEMLIANWLFIHGVEYRYEAPYHVEDTSDSKHRQYQPDFFLPAHNLYIEHWGIDRDGSTAPFVNRAAYHLGMKWKRELHQEHGTTLVETFHYEQREGTLLSGLEARLLAHGVQPRRISAEQLKQKLVAMNEFRPFTGLLGTFLSLFKSHPATFDGVKSRAKSSSDPARSIAFLELFEGIFDQYEQHLRQDRTIDFHDMISQATDRVRTGRYRSPSTQIIVDEFQDVSPARAELLKALLAQHDDAHLFCVGDDWQSIFRFAGADLDIMTGFSRHLGVTQRTDLDRTFRFNDVILSATTRFVTTNPDQLRKQISSETRALAPQIHILVSPVDTRLELQLMRALDRIAEQDATASVLLLARFNHTLNGVPKTLLKQYTGLRIKSHTVHAAKGLEADYVVVMDVTAGRYGFPCEISDDPVLELLLANTDRFPNAEERRLFYVALTRARYAAYVLTDEARPSSFVAELAGVDYASEVKNVATDWQPARCPICDGQLVRREGPHGIFWGCSNFPYCQGKGYTCRECDSGVIMISDADATCSNPACSSRPTVCKGCGKGVMVPRTGPSGGFYGCSSFPECRYTANAL